MKAASITLKASKTSDVFTVVKLVNTLRFPVGSSVKKSEVENMINNNRTLKVIIV